MLELRGKILMNKKNVHVWVIEILRRRGNEQNRTGPTKGQTDNYIIRIKPEKGKRGME